MPLRRHRETLDRLYARYNRREFVSPDPLQFLYGYEDPADVEVVGLVAATLAYGRVAMILRSVAAVLDRLGPGPSRAVRDASAEGLRRAMAGFKHRFTPGDEVAALLGAAGRVRRRRGSLGACLSAGAGKGDATVLPALAALVGELSQAADGPVASLLSDPARGSACKRLHLYLRWMVRRDAVDLGVWREVPPGRLLVPLDTHMHRLGRTLGVTCRAAADRRTALEITDAFRRIVPDDPVRYDFSLTRLGIRADASPEEWFGEGK